MSAQRLYKIVVASLFLLSGSNALRAQDYPHLYASAVLCYPNPCSPGYVSMGPLHPGSSAPTLTMPANSTLSEAQRHLIEARRFGQSQELRAWANSYNQNLQKELARANEEVRIQLQAAQQEINRSILASRAQLAPIYIPTPLPQDAVAASLQRPLDPLFESFKKRDPINTAQEVFRLERQLKTYSANHRKYYESELRRNFVDHRGLLRNLPEAARLPQGGLLSERDSPEGQQLRQGLNLVGAANFVIAAYAERAPESPELKSALQSYEGLSQDLSTALLLADRVVVSDPATGRALVAKLLPPAQFIAGVAQGIGSGAIDFVQGLGKIAQLAANGVVTGLTQAPAQTFSDISQGLYKAVTTPWIPKLYEGVKSIATQSYKTALYGTAEERGKLVGRVTFEIAAAVYGGELIKGATAGGSLMTRVATKSLSRFAAETEFASMRAAGTLAENLGPGLTRLATETPELAANILRGEKALPALEKVADLSTDQLAHLRRFESFEPDLAARAIRESPLDAVRIGETLEYRLTSATARHADIDEAYMKQLLAERRINSPSDFQPALARDKPAMYLSFSKPQTFYRYISSMDGDLGSFLTLTRPTSLSSMELKEALAVKKIPQYYMEVTVPAETKMSLSVAAENDFGSGGALQWRIEQPYKKEWYSSPKPLPRN